MKPFTFGLAIALLAGSAIVAAQDFPEMPKPQKEHEWLGQLAGEWEYQAEAVMAPGQPAMKCNGTESIRKLGGFWIVAEAEGHMLEMTVNSVMTLGYDAEKKKYVGTWVDSMQNHMWKYEATLDKTGKILTLVTKGPNFATPGKMSNYKETLEIKDKDHKVFTSSVETEDGKWFQFMTASYTRKK